MEAKKGKAMDQGSERKIPVFTVLKNGVILKNIFVVNSSDSHSPERNLDGGDDHEVEEILVIGRHPDCNIMLTHPSISRFHLKIRSIPSRQKLFVTDLSSVHGTWVSDQRIEAGTDVEVKEGDTIRIGGSTRIYRLHWIPLSRAYDMDDPFVSPLDVYAAKETEEENGLLNSENVKVPYEDGKLVWGESEAPQLDWTSDETASSNPREDLDSFVKDISSLPLASPSAPFAGDSLGLQKQQSCEDVYMSPNVVTDIVEVEAEIPRSRCFAGTRQNVNCPVALSSFLFAELAEDADSENLHQEDHEETEVVSSQVMEASASLFTENEPLSEIINKDIPCLDFGWQPFSATLCELVEKANNQNLIQEDNEETEVVTQEVVAVSAQSCTATEPLLETKTKVIHGPLFSGQPLYEIQNEQVELADNQSLHQEDNGEINVISRQVMEVSSCSFPETEPPLETKNEDIQGPSLAWQPESESQSELAGTESLHEEDVGEAGDVALQVMMPSSCSFPETEPLLETKSLYIQDQFLGWQPLPQIQTEVKPPRDQNLNPGLTGESEETFDEANNLSLCKGYKQSELRSSLSATNGFPNVQQLESVMDIELGGASEEAYSLNGSESHQNNEDMGFITEETAKLLQPAEVMFSDITEGKVNQTPRSHTVRRIIPETENLRMFPLESEKRSSAFSNGSRRIKSAAVLQTQTKKSEGKAKRIGSNCKAPLLAKGAINRKSLSPSLNAGIEKLDPEIFTLDKKNLTLTPNTHTLEIGSSSLHAGSVKLEPEVFTPDKENLTPNTHFLKRLQEIGDIKESKTLSLFAEPEILESESFTPDRENLTPNAHVLKRLQEAGDIKEKKSSLKAPSRPLSLKIPSSSEDVSGEVLQPEIFTPDKENLTPNSLMRKRLQEFGKLQGNKDSPKVPRKLFSSKPAFSLDMHSEENIVPVEKENQSALCSTSSRSKLKHGQVLSKRKTKRAPFQPLVEKSAVKSEQRAEASNAFVTNGNSRGSLPSSILSNGKNTMKWTIVVDTSSLLDMKSRKSLQLLQGLKGTQLVIPRTVLRELDERKRSCGLFFRRTTDVASSALEWIQECMIKTNWWVQIQSSSEETRSTAPTPPVSPSVFSDSSAFPFQLHCAAPEITSPTSEDSVLECALLNRKRYSEGQLILLSNDVTLKIKAMAEGIICETAQEFYESIKNPFSERFMWTESLPRGQTWSFQHKKSSKGESSAKGLKLILLHNSHYGLNKSSSLVPS